MGSAPTAPNLGKRSRNRNKQRHSENQRPAATGIKTAFKGVWESYINTTAAGSLENTVEEDLYDVSDNEERMCVYAYTFVCINAV
jgi:hypothetical protein